MTAAGGRNEPHFEKRDETVVAAPAVLAGIGALAHHTVPAPPRDEDVEALSMEEVLERLEDVEWRREVEVAGTTVYPWEGIAGKLTPSGRFAIGGAKEVGYAVARALEEPASEGGRRVRPAGPMRP